MLHTVADPALPPARADVVFNDVIAYQLEGDNFSHVLLAIVDTPLQEPVRDHQALFAANRKYCWPGPWNESTEPVLTHCESSGGAALSLVPAPGMGGWVIARSCEIKIGH